MTNSDALLPVLTPKQRLFVEQYLLDMNATQAAVRAGYSKKTANEQGAQLLRKSHIKAAIDASKIKRSDKLEVDSEWMLTRLVDEVEADLADLYNENGDLKPVSEWPEIWRQGLVAGVEVEALFDGLGKDRKQIGYTKKIRLSDRLRRLELIGKHVRVNAFQEVVSHKGLDTLADRLERAHKREPDNSTSALADKPRPAATKEAAMPLASPLPPPPTAAAPAPPPRPSPYHPIMPIPEPASWPLFGASASAEYDPFKD